MYILHDVMTDMVALTIVVPIYIATLRRVDGLAIDEHLNNLY